MKAMKKMSVFVATPIAFSFARICPSPSSIAAIIASEVFEYLDAPVVRVAVLDVPIPYSPPLEDAVLPNKQKILEALEQLARY